MDGKNPEANTLAFKRARSRTLKIKELGIKPDMTEKQIDALITKVSKAKAKETGTKWEEHVKGQRIYIENLVVFSKIPTAAERIEYEYYAAFADAASDEEKVDELEKLMAS